MNQFIMKVTNCNKTATGFPVAARRCLYCSKTLPRVLRKDAMYCPGSGCRVYAHRRRALTGEKPPTRKPIVLRTFRSDVKESLTKQVVAQLQRKRRQAKLPLLIQDQYLQANAEKQAYELLRRRLSDMEWDARDRAWDAKRRYFSDREELVVENDWKIKIDPATTHIGLFVIPRELGGTAVLLTGRSSDRSRW